VLFLLEMSLSRCKWKSVSKVYENKIEHDQFQGKGAYVAEMEIRRSMELQGAVEVVLNLRLPDGFLLLLAAEKFQGDPGLDNRPMTGLLGRPRAKYLLGGRHKLGNPVGGAGRSGGVDVPRVPELLAAF
jgi:hypothetical protein